MIDVHSHFLSLEFVEHLRGRSAFPRSTGEGPALMVHCGTGMTVPVMATLTDMDEKLEGTAAMGIEMSVLSHALPPDVLGGDEADKWACRINDQLAGLVAACPARLAGFGCLGMGDPQRAIDETTRCVTELGLRGIQLFSSRSGRPLDSAEWLPVYRHVAELGVPLVLHPHPVAPLNLTGLDSPSLVGGLAFIYDTSLAAVRLICAGLFDQAPGLRLIVPHAGGILPYLHGRLDACFQPMTVVRDSDLPPLRRPFAQYLNQLYVDTVTYHQAALECCYQVLGAEHMLAGTDHPFGPCASAAGLLSGLDCPEPDRELILHGNAERLLGLGQAEAQRPSPRR